MMLVQNYIDKSANHGLGVFAGEFIPKGNRIWEFTEGCDQIYSAERLAALLPVQRGIIMFYCHVEPGLPGVVLCCDNARHYNYSRDPNTGPLDGPVTDGSMATYAIRDIQRGEELTFSVLEDDDAERKLGPALYAELSGAK